LSLCGAELYLLLICESFSAPTLQNPSPRMKNSRFIPLQSTTLTISSIEFSNWFPAQSMHAACTSHWDHQDFVWEQALPSPSSSFRGSSIVFVQYLFTPAPAMYSCMVSRLTRSARSSIIAVWREPPELARDWRTANMLSKRWNTVSLPSGATDANSRDIHHHFLARYFSPTCVTHFSLLWSS